MNLVSQIQQKLSSMPPVAAMQVRVVGQQNGRMVLDAPLDVNVNDKDCAFGGSLAGLMTLAGWACVEHWLLAIGQSCDVYVAENNVRYLNPLYEDLRAEAWVSSETNLQQSLLRLEQKGRVSINVEAHCQRADGKVATHMSARYVAMRRQSPGSGA